VEIIKDKERPRAIVVGLRIKQKKQTSVNGVTNEDDCLEELSLLLDTLGVDVILKEIQYRESPSPATYIGEGKVNELSQYAREKNISMVVFDNELSSAQARNLSKIFGIGVFDRTEIILDIFSKHAKTKAAKIQVDIAKMEFMMSRIQGLWSHFDRQKGGIGLKDAGEKQIELDRRLIRDRISRLKKNLIHIENIKNTQRKLREDIIQVALVGYTNAGKTTIMNALTDSDLLVENKLFATLDSTVKILNPGNRPKILISDTVGFIDKLPHRLIASFKSTLDELYSADLILHVVDISSGNIEKHIEVTHRVLDELKVNDKPSFIVFNKVDTLKGELLLSKLIKRKYLESIMISAHKEQDIMGLRSKIINFFENRMLDVEIEIPYTLQDKLYEIHQVARIIDTKYNDDCVYLKFKIAATHYDRLVLEKYVVRGKNGKL